MAECSNTPPPGTRVMCEEDATSTEEINIDVKDTTITTEGSERDGVHGLHQGKGQIVLRVSDSTIKTSENFSLGIFANQNGSDNDDDTDANITIDASDNTITTEGVSSNGIWGLNTSRGNVDITTNSNTVTTEGNGSGGIHGKHMGTGHITIDSTGDEITTNVGNSHGIRGWHTSEGNIDITANSDTITTNSAGSDGIEGYHYTGDGTNSGNIDITTNNNEITTKGSGAHGIQGYHRGTGHITIDSTGDEIIVEGRNSRGIMGWHTAEGNIDITANSDTITTNNDVSHGILGYHYTGDGTNSGNIDITTNSNTITTKGSGSHGILGYHRGTGHITIDSTGDEITVEGQNSRGIMGWHTAEGNIDITANSDIITNNDASHGIYGLHYTGDGTNSGNIDITTNNNTITTKGSGSHGILGYHSGTGDISIKAGMNHKIITEGAGSHGIYALHTGTDENRMINIVTGNIDASGEGSVGVHIGRARLSEDGLAQDVASINDGLRQNSVTINGKITAETGVYIAGGGMVTIESTGSINASSGKAIHATGDNPGEGIGDSPTKPKLIVAIVLGGREVVDIIGKDGRIINDGGETTIVVNGVTLHDGTDGVDPDAIGVDGIREYRISTEGDIVDGGFSAADFIWEYSPRAGFYEVLPNFLFHLNNQVSGREHIRSSDSPYWISLSREFWGYGSTSSTVGGKYKASQNLIEAGVDFRIGDNLVSSASISRIEGSADVSQRREGGGKILADGRGLALDLSWDRTDGWYARSGLSFAEYTLALRSESQGGTFASGVEAKNRSFDVEAGRNIKLSNKLDLVPRIRARKTSISADNFTDTVGAHVSMPKTSRRALSIGVVAKVNPDTPRLGGEIDWQASIDLENSNDGDGTLVEAAGEKLVSASRSNRAILGLGGNWQRGNLFINGEIRAAAPSSANARISGQITVGAKF